MDLSTRSQRALLAHRISLCEDTRWPQRLNQHHISQPSNGLQALFRDIKKA
ncbi:MAG: hypothetical protein AAFR42_02925 [Cyanobacteria bacterium J06628_6]